MDKGFRDSKLFEILELIPKRGLSPKSDCETMLGTACRYLLNRTGMEGICCERQAGKSKYPDRSSTVYVNQGVDREKKPLRLGTPVRVFRRKVQHTTVKV